MTEYVNLLREAQRLHERLRLTADKAALWHAAEHHQKQAVRYELATNAMEKGPAPDELEAREPVAWLLELITDTGTMRWSAVNREHLEDITTEIPLQPLYTAPPAPQVPDAWREGDEWRAKSLYEAIHRTGSQPEGGES